MTRHRNHHQPPLFRGWNEEALKARAVVAPSINIQRNVAVNSLGDLEGLLFERGKKVIVQQVIAPLDESSGMYQVKVDDNLTVAFYGQSLKRFPAGGAANVSLVLNQYGVSPVLLLAPLGTGPTSQSLSNALDRPGIMRAFLTADGTNLTLAVVEKGTGRTILLCEKNPYKFPYDEAVATLRGLKPRVVAMTSVRPVDAPLVRGLLKAFESKRVIKTVMPHPELLLDKNELPRFRAILPEFDLVQVNLTEAKLLADSDTAEPESAEDARQQGEELAVKILGFGPRRVAVTLRKYGAAAAVRDGRQTLIISQPGYASQPVDLAGAGDVHFATLLYYHWFHRSNGGGRDGILFGKALRMASWVAACAVRHQGPFNGIPSESKRRHFLRGGGKEK